MVYRELSKIADVEVSATTAAGPCSKQKLTYIQPIKTVKPLPYIPRLSRTHQNSAFHMQKWFIISRDKINWMCSGPFKSDTSSNIAHPIFYSKHYHNPSKLHATFIQLRCTVTIKYNLVFSVFC